MVASCPPLILLLLPLVSPASAEWQLLFRQTAGLWQDSAKWMSVSASPTNPNYSILHTVSASMKGPGGYTLKLKYPQGADGKQMAGENVWTQTESPTTTPAGCGKKCPGYTSISASWECGFSGIQKCSCSRNSALLCNTNKADDWWFALGTAKAWTGDTFPGPCHKTAKQVELWICINSKDNCVTVGEDLTGGAGWGIPFLLWGSLGVLGYIGLGLVVGKRRRGTTAGAARLSAHPHYPLWLELGGLAQDGFHYARSGKRGAAGGATKGLLGEGGGGRRDSSRHSHASVSSVGSGKSSKSSSKKGKKEGKKSSSSSSSKDSKARRKSGGGGAAAEAIVAPAPAPPPVNLGRQDTAMTDAFGNVLRR